MRELFDRSKPQLVKEIQLSHWLLGKGPPLMSFEDNVQSTPQELRHYVEIFSRLPLPLDSFVGMWQGSYVYRQDLAVQIPQSLSVPERLLTSSSRTA